jgi:sulfur carrier protein
MEIKLNGQTELLEKEVSISELLTLKNVDMPEMVSVEYNGDILDRAQFDTTQVKSGDQIEFLYFMGGGHR